MSDPTTTTTADKATSTVEQTTNDVSRGIDDATSTTADSTTTTTGETETATNKGTRFGKGLGDTVKGVLQSAHGVGETIRGNINDALDQAGEGIASRNTAEDRAAREAKLAEKGLDPHQNAGVARSGIEEAKDGLGTLKSVPQNFKKDTPATHE